MNKTLADQAYELGIDVINQKFMLPARDVANLLIGRIVDNHAFGICIDYLDDLNYLLDDDLPDRDAQFEADILDWYNQPIERS